MIAYSYVFILLTLASGYFSLKLTHVFKYRITKYSGQELLFSSAVVGLLIALAGYLVCYVIESCLPTAFSHYSDFFNDKSIMYATSGFGVAIFIVIPVINFFRKNDDAVSKFIKEQNDGIEGLLEISQLQIKPLTITLVSGKVYIGLVVQSFFSPHENKSFTIAPLFSGFRNSHLDLIITNRYIDLINNYQDSGEEELINDFKVALLVESIVSVSIFNPDIYEELNDQDEQISIT